MYDDLWSTESYIMAAECQINMTNYRCAFHVAVMVIRVEVFEEIYYFQATI